MKVKIILSIMLVFSSSLLKAQTNDTFEKDTSAVETKLDRELEKAQGGIQHALVIGTAIDGYDKLLNSYYKKALAIIKPEDKKVFINAQKAWLQWKIAEVKLITLTQSPKYSGFSSDMAAYIAGEELTLIKNRTIELYNYWNLFGSGFGQ